MQVRNTMTTPPRSVNLRSLRASVHRPTAQTTPGLGTPVPGAAIDVGLDKKIQVRETRFAFETTRAQCGHPGVRPVRL